MCNFCMLYTHPDIGWIHYKKYTYFRKKERPALEGDTFNSYPDPPLQQPCSSFFIYSVRYKSEISRCIIRGFPFRVQTILTNNSQRILYKGLQHPYMKLFSLME